MIPAVPRGKACHRRPRRHFIHYSSLASSIVSCYFIDYCSWTSLRQGAKTTWKSMLSPALWSQVKLCLQVSLSFWPLHREWSTGISNQLETRSEFRTRFQISLNLKMRMQWRFCAITYVHMCYMVTYYSKWQQLAAAIAVANPRPSTFSWAFHKPVGHVLWSVVGWKDTIYWTFHRWAYLAALERQPKALQSTPYNLCRHRL